MTDVVASAAGDQPTAASVAEAGRGRSLRGGGAEPPVTPAPTRSRRRARLRLWLVAAVLVGALGYLLAEGLGNALDYFQTVDQALAHRASLGTSTFRLEGVVDKGTVESTSTGARFRLSQGGHTVQVVNRGSPPQLFQPGIPVVVVGHFTSRTSDTFVSDEIMVKHSANYIARHPHRVVAPNGTVR